MLLLYLECDIQCPVNDTNVYLYHELLIISQLLGIDILQYHFEFLKTCIKMKYLNIFIRQSAGNPDVHYGNILSTRILKY